MLVWLFGRGADLHMAQLMPLPLTVSCSSKSRLDLPFWYLLTRVVPSPGQRAIKWVLLLVIAFPAAFTGEDRNFIYGTDDDVTHFCMHNSGLRKTLPWLVDCA